MGNRIKKAKMLHQICIGISFIMLVSLSSCGDPVERHVQEVMAGGDDREEALMGLLFAKAEALPAVLAVLQDTSQPAQGRADLVEILWKIYIRESDARIVPALLKHIDDPAPEVRQAVAMALGEMGDKQVIHPLLKQLLAEKHENTQLQLLIALEILDRWELQRSDSGSITISGGTELTEEEKTQFTQQLVEIYRRTSIDALRNEAEEILAKIAAQWVQDGDRRILQADLKGAEEQYRKALEFLPDHLNASLRLGQLFFFYGDQQRGLEILESHGMVVRAKRMQQAPIIDGDLSDPAWAQAAKIDRFYQNINMMRLVPAEGNSEAYVGYTSTSVYLAVKGYEENTQDLTARHKTRDDPVWFDDCAEVFFDIDLDRRTFYQIVVNSLGTKADLFYAMDKRREEETELQWDGDQRVATRVEPAYWIMEMEVPFSNFGDVQIKRGDIWGFNVARVRITHGGEYDQWIPTYGWALRPDRFGFLVFD
jgi:tetratricopeptide (TPR) repeat protein